TAMIIATPVIQGCHRLGSGSGSGGGGGGSGTTTGSGSGSGSGRMGDPHRRQVTSMTRLSSRHAGHGTVAGRRIPAAPGRRRRTMSPVSSPSSGERGGVTQNKG